MADYESKPLTGGGELYTSRVQSGPGMQTMEMVCGYGTLLLATAAGIVCIVEGLKSHPEHIIMGAVIIFAAVQFALTARLYKNDLLQDRKVVYLSCFVVVALSAAGIIYATTWTADSGSGGSAVPSSCRNGYYSQGQCITFQQPVTKNYSGFLLNNSTTGSKPTVNIVNQWAKLCGFNPVSCSPPPPPPPAKD